ncbi:MAG: PEP-CTERM sorting domain-containing protein [Armatimonadota bacterium]|nr:PEP-CTERM sorting domain-containing protein [Armatimonadota bacterium]
MVKKSFLLIATIALLSFAGLAYAAYLDGPNGYAVQDIVFQIQPGEYVAGFDRLPDGNFVAFSGSRIVKVTSDGNVSTLYTFNSPVYGSFVKVRGEAIYFGESSNGTIWQMGLDGSNPQLIGTLQNNFDLEFNSLGQAFVSANPGWAGQKVFLFDGTADEIVIGLSGYSGPLAFDGSDNLLYATAWARGGDSILLFSAADVASAIGPTSLTQADGQVLASSIGSPYDMELDVLGNIFFTSGGTLYKLANGSGVATGFASVHNPCHYLTTLRYSALDNSLSVLIGGDTVGVISTLTPVPEPGSLLSLSAMLAGAATMFRRRLCNGIRRRS